MSDKVDYGALRGLAGFQIRKAYGQVFQTFKDMFRELGLAPGQYGMLLLIARNPGLNQMQLAEATGIERSTVVPITNRFAELGWIERTRRADDRRAYSLEITAAGREILDRAEPILAAHEEQLLASLAPDEQRELVRLLTKVNDAS